MKKLLLSLVIVAVAGVAMAAPRSPVNTPRDQRGEGAYPGYGGYSAKRNSATAEDIVCAGRCLLHALIVNTGHDASTLLVRDTSVSGQGGVQNTKLLLPYRAVNTAPRHEPIVLDMLLDSGISVTLSSVSKGEEVTVIYLDLD